MVINPEQFTKRINNEIIELERLIIRINKGLNKAKQNSEDYYFDSVALNLHVLY